MSERGWVRVPVVVSFPEQPAALETYGFTGSQGQVVLEGQLLRPAAPASTVFLFMHPATTLQMLPMPSALADAGLHVLCAGSRYARNDSALIMEKVAVDLGAYIRHAREALGYRTVVLVGWSGGGALSLFYQAQAEQPTVTHTPAGDPYDLTVAALPKADAIVFIAAHLSRAETLTEWMDPSVLDEADPDQRDPEFDIYAADARHRPPYDAAFVAAFRERPAGPQPPDHHVGAGDDRDPAPPRHGGDRASVRRPPHHVRRALAGPGRGPERPRAGLVLCGRPACGQRGAGRAGALHDAAVLAVPVVLRPIQRTGTGQRRQGSLHARAADRERRRRRRASDPQPGHPGRPRHSEQGVRADRGRQRTTTRGSPPRCRRAWTRCSAGCDGRSCSTDDPQAASRSVHLRREAWASCSAALSSSALLVRTVSSSRRPFGSKK